MSSPPGKYVRHTDFTDFSTAHPDEQQPGVDLDVEFDGIKATTDATINRLAEIQRDDGRLANQSVHKDSLDRTTLALMVGVGVPRGDWATGTIYAAKDLVMDGGVTYIAVSAHTAGASFSTDFSAGKWLLFTNDPQRIATAPTLTAAKSLFAAPVVVPDGAVMYIACREMQGDLYAGTFIYNASDTTTTFPYDAFGIVDNLGRRWFRYLSAGFALVNWAGVVTDFSEDCSAKIRSVIDQAQANKISRVRFDGQLLVSSAIYDKEPCPRGLIFEGNGLNSWTTGQQGDSTDILKSDGAFNIFEFSEDNGTAQVGRMIFRDFAINCTDGGGGAVSLNFLDQDGTDYTPTDDSTTPNYMTQVEFANMMIQGAFADGTDQAGDGIRGKKLFNLLIRENVTIRGFRRGVFGKGIDNATINGDIVSNGRNVHLEQSGTFGNDPEINLSYIGPTYDAGEDQYSIWDASKDLVLRAGLVEQSSSGATAGIYLNGSNFTVESPHLATTRPAFRFGPDASGKIIAPQGTAGADTASLIDGPTSYEMAFASGPPNRIVVYDADLHAAKAIGSHPRILYRHVDDGNGQVVTIPSDPSIDDNGVHPIRRFFVSTHRFDVKWTDRGLTGISGMSADSGSQSGWIAVLDHTDTDAGFMREFVVPGEIKNGDILRVTIRSRNPTPVASGSWRVVVMKNSVDVDHANITASASFNTFVYSYGGLTGLTSSDVVQITILNNGADQDLYFEAMEIAIVQAAITAPTGGTTIDTEARAAISSILGALAAANITA